MAEQNLVARRTHRRRGTTRPEKSARKAPDALRRDFTPPAQPDIAWVGDLTEIPTNEGKLHLASVLDLHSRRCVGFAMGIHHDAALARAALCVAIAIRGGAVAGVLFHTDQGGEYTGEIFAQACRSAGVTQSMGRTGSALDNAIAKAFNSTLEWELLRNNHFHTREQPGTWSLPGSTTTTANAVFWGWLSCCVTLRRPATRVGSATDLPGCGARGW